MPTLIITTYNRPDALDAVLRAVARQTRQPMEVLIADDGSASPTRDVITSWRGKFSVPLHHIWQEDRGFRAAEARNRALARATGDLVIFLDGDCLPAPDFVARHAALAEPGFFVAGHRILLSSKFTAEVLAGGVTVETLPVARLVPLRLSGAVNRLIPALRLGDGVWRRRRQDWQGVRTCNLAVWRQDMLRIDGLDSAFQGWGLEDTDLAIRLVSAGIKRKDGRFATGVFHLWHREADRSSLNQNRQLLDAMIAERRIRAVKGLSSLATPAEEGR